MRSRRWAWVNAHALPLFLTALATAVVAGSGLAAVLILDRDDDGDDPPTEADCPVGTWEVVNYTENSALGSARMVDGTSVFRFGEDGTGVADFSPDFTITATIVGVSADAGVTGQITYRYEISGETFEFVEQDSTARFSSDLDLVGLDEVLTMPTGPLDYTCDGDAMTIAGGSQAFEYRRSG